MRTKKRSNQQLQRTSDIRHRVFEFMRRFDAKLNWTMDGPMDTDCDEILCFTYFVGEKTGVAIIQTWCLGGWSIYTEPTSSADIEVTFRAIEAQVIERSDIPSAVHLRSSAAIALMVALKQMLAVMDGPNDLSPVEQDAMEVAHRAISYAEGKLLSSINGLVTEKQFRADPVARYFLPDSIDPTGVLSEDGT